MRNEKLVYDEFVAVDSVIYTEESSYNENNTTQSAIGISTDEAFIAILKNLKENYEEV